MSGRTVIIFLVVFVLGPVLLVFGLRGPTILLLLMIGVFIAVFSLFSGRKEEE